MVFHLVGLGLGDDQDITLKGLKALKGCAKIYLEAYTSVLTVPKEQLEEAWGVSIEIADRTLVETGVEEAMLERAKAEDIALLVVGDPFGATTHCDLLERAKEMGVPLNVVHNASIMNAVGCCGLQLYRFGETVSICFFSPNWRPDSFYDKLVANKAAGLHSLALLDIKVKEPTMASLARGKPLFLPPRFMTIRQACLQLIEVEEKRGGGICGPEARGVAVARVGAATQQLVHGSLSELATVEMGGPLHSLVLVGAADEVELGLLGAFCVKAAEAPQMDADAIEAADAETLANAEAHEGKVAGGGRVVF